MKPNYFLFVSFFSICFNLNGQIFPTALQDSVLKLEIFEKTKDYEYLVFSDISSFWDSSLQLKGFGKKGDAFYKIILEFEKNGEFDLRYFDLKSLGMYKSEIDEITSNISLDKLDVLSNDSITRTGDDNKDRWPVWSDQDHWVLLVVKPKKYEYKLLECYDPISMQNYEYSEQRSIFMEAVNNLNNNLIFSDLIRSIKGYEITKFKNPFILRDENRYDSLRWEIHIPGKKKEIKTIGVKDTLFIYSEDETVALVNVYGIENKNLIHLNQRRVFIRDQAIPEIYLNKINCGINGRALVRKGEKLKFKCLYPYGYPKSASISIRKIIFTIGGKTFVSTSPILNDKLNARIFEAKKFRIQLIYIEIDGKEHEVLFDTNVLLVN